MTSIGMDLAIDRDWINGLNAGRKADRQLLTMALETIARAHGAVIERRDEKPVPGYSGASIYLRMTIGGVGVQTSISNLHGGYQGLASWFNDYSDGHRGARDFSGRFAVAVGDGTSISSGRRHHKATSCGPDWYSLAKAIDAGLMLAARGDAFEPSVT